MSESSTQAPLERLLDGSPALRTAHLVFTPPEVGRAIRSANAGRRPRASRAEAHFSGMSCSLQDLHSAAVAGRQACGSPGSERGQLCVRWRKVVAMF